MTTDPLTRAITAEAARDEMRAERDAAVVALAELDTALARAEEAERERDQMRDDLRVAAGELLVEIPQPGTEAARLLSANVLMRGERDEARAWSRDLSKTLDAIAEGLGRYHAWDYGWQRADDATLIEAAKALPAAEGEKAEALFERDEARRERDAALARVAEVERTIAGLEADMRNATRAAVDAQTERDAAVNRYEALVMSIASFWKRPDDDRPLPEDDAIDAAHPTRTGRHGLYAEAMRLVGARRSKGGLVGLVCWLLHRIEEKRR